MQRRHPAATLGIRRRCDATLRPPADAEEAVLRLVRLALLLPDADGAAADTAVARLVSVSPGGVSLSAGTAVRSSGDDAAALLQRADQALYRCKRSRT